MTIQHLILLLNILWFSGGFILFGIQPRKCMKIFRPDLDSNKEENQLPLRIIPFVGGFNFAFAILNLVAFYIISENFNEDIILLVFISSGVAHLTQFSYNIPIAFKKDVEHGAVWNVLEGQMLFIFIIDFSLSLFNFSGLLL